MKPPTPAQIKKNLEWLKDNKTKIRHFTAFNDDNWGKIEAEIVVLEEDLSEDDICDRSNSEGEDDDGKEWNSSQQDAALGVRRWLDGDEETSPIENWKGLVQK